MWHRKQSHALLVHTAAHDFLFQTDRMRSSFHSKILLALERDEALRRQTSPNLLAFALKHISWQTFRWALAIVGAYSFTLPSDESCALLPFADMLNARTGYNNARLFAAGHHFMKMEAIRTIPAGDQIYNTYGQLSNAELLCRYGYVDIPNPYSSALVNIKRSAASFPRSYAAKTLARVRLAYRRCAIQHPGKLPLFSPQNRKRSAIVRWLLARNPHESSSILAHAIETALSSHQRFLRTNGDGLNRSGITQSRISPRHRRHEHEQHRSERRAALAIQLRAGEASLLEAWHRVLAERGKCRVSSRGEESLDHKGGAP
eukprot:CAMPEP_0185847402 /NCGR_PEP_ID=MMETSP1354-20130828/2690_1 /TAXON_ID=708628 /ORGANISM="Erythrolobus madagascarensis, Strain CCMP3276" /LENGTH=316 /DNA_ID=CAMNT_0028547691 /DNA_START=247 /DNA_END=1197 /DNA_ORIENTATION=-